MTSNQSKKSTTNVVSNTLRDSAGASFDNTKANLDMQDPLKNTDYQYVS